MNKREFWKKMDAAIDNPNLMMATMEMAVLLKQAYLENLSILAQVFYSAERPGIGFQAYIGRQTERFLICYTSEEQAKKEMRGGDWNELNVKDVINNLFQKAVIVGLVFNCADEDRMFIVPKKLLREMIPENIQNN